MKLNIIYEDNDVIVVDKPAGLVVHSDGRTDEITLADLALEMYPELLDVGDAPIKLTANNLKLKAITRPGIVHRLDRDTSGVMVLARTQKAFLHIKKQFQEHTVEKEYRAFVYGKIKNDEGVVDRPIGRSPSDFRKWSATRGARGELREAVTEYKVLERGTEATYLAVFPKTGRTHQIRVHLKAINYPVVCDKLYAPQNECILGFSRHALHAHKITLALPSGERKTFEAPFPQDFTQALDILNRV